MFGTTVLWGQLFQKHSVLVSWSTKSRSHVQNNSTITCLKTKEIHKELKSSFHMTLVSVLLWLLVVWLQYYVKLVESFISSAMHLA